MSRNSTPRCWHFWRWHRHPHADGSRQCAVCCLAEDLGTDRRDARRVLRIARGMEASP